MQQQQMQQQMQMQQQQMQHQERNRRLGELREQRRRVRELLDKEEQEGAHSSQLQQAIDTSQAAVLPNAERIPRYAATPLRTATAGRASRRREL